MVLGRKEPLIWFSAAMMLDWLAEKHDHAPTMGAARRIEAAVDRAFANGIKPPDLGGRDGTAAVAKAVLAGL
jgi:3-isopropylmalate dehydrogenase